MGLVCAFSGACSTVLAPRFTLVSLFLLIIILIVFGTISLNDKNVFDFVMYKNAVSITSAGKFSQTIAIHFFFFVSLQILYGSGTYTFLRSRANGPPHGSLGSPV